MSIAQEVPTTDPLAAMLADPEIRQALAVLIANAPTLAALAAMSTALLARSPQIADNVNDLVLQLRNETEGGSGSVISTAVTSLTDLAPVASALASRAETVTGFLDSAILQPEIVTVVGCVGEAALEADRRTRGKTVEVGGFFAIIRQLKDPGVQETLAFLFEFAKVFGSRQRAGE